MAAEASGGFLFPVGAGQAWLWRSPRPWVSQGQGQLWAEEKGELERRERDMPLCMVRKAEGAKSRDGGIVT